jgi:hypothetical protein
MAKTILERANGGFLGAVSWRKSLCLSQNWAFFFEKWYFSECAGFKK